MTTIAIDSFLKKNEGKEIVIFAPHIDDEVIGAWRLLNERKISSVYYFHDLYQKRVEEAKLCATCYKFEPRFVTNKDELSFEPDTIILVPHIKDSHPHHKVVNAFAKTLPNKKYYYSVEMNVDKEVLTGKQQAKKASELNANFPSQQELFKSDARYALFESLVDKDYTEFVEFEFENFVYADYGNDNTGVSLFRTNLSLEVKSDDSVFDLKNTIHHYVVEDVVPSRTTYDYCKLKIEELSQFLFKNYPSRSFTLSVKSFDNGVGSSYQFNRG